MPDIARLGLAIDSRQVVQADRALDKFRASGARAETASKTLTSQTRAMGLAFRSLLGPLASVYAIFSTFGILRDFSVSMAQVEAITKSTGFEMAQLTAKARELGASTEFTASQAADAMVYLARAGLSTDEVLKAINETLNLGTAAQIGLADASRITSTILKTFQIDASRTSDVTDVLAAASAAANTNVLALGETMKYVGLGAQSVGLSLNNTAAAAAALADAGLVGSQAGTGLRRVMGALLNPTKEAQKIIKSLGLTLKEIRPDANSLVDIMTRFNKAGLTFAQALEIGGQRGGSVLIGLSDNAAKLAEVTKQMGNITGEAQRQATVIRDSLGQDWKTLVSAMQEFVLAAGEAGATASLRASLQTLTSLVRKLAENMEYLQVVGIALIAKFIGPYIATLGTATASTFANIAAVVRMGNVAGITAIAVRGLNAALAFIGGPVGLAIAAAGAIYFLSDRQSSAQKAAEAHKKAIEELDAAMGTLPGRARTAGEAVRNLALKHIEAAEAALKNAQAQLESAKATTKAFEESSFGRNRSATAAARARNESLETYVESVKKRVDELAALRSRLTEINRTLFKPITIADIRALGLDELGLNKNGATPAPAVLNAYQSLIQKTKDHIELLKTEAATAALTGEASIKLKLQLDALRAARKAGVSVNQKELDQLKEELALRSRLAEQARIRADLEFNRKTSLLSNEDRQIAQSLRSLYGNDIPAALASTEAAYAKTTIRLQELQSTTDQFIGSATSGMTSALTDIAVGTKSAGDAFRNLGLQVVRSLAEMIVKMTITIPLARALQSALGGGGLFGGFFGASSAGVSSGIISGVAHQGGVIGSGSLANRYVHPAYFENAPRLHGGGMIDYAGGERPVVGLVGERMLNRQETAAYNRHESNTTVRVHIENRGGVAVSETKPPAGFDFGLLLEHAVDQRVDKRLVDHSRPGGLLNN